MRTLDLKLFRELRRQRVQIASISLVMGCGTMTIMGLRTTLTSVRSARDEFFAGYRFADVFAHVERAPATMASRLAAIPGVAAVETRIVRDVRRIARVTRRAAVLQRGSLHELGRQVADELGVRSPVRLALTRELAVPVSWGLWHPVVLLPAAARRWTPERRRVVLRHELAHVRRGDYAGHVLIELACALHWLNPLVWRAA